MTPQASPPPAPPAGTGSPATHAWLAWVLVMTLSSLVVAIIAGMLTVHDGGTPARAFLTGGGAFVASVSVVLGLLQAARILRGTP